jgi:hypothetical protein
MHDLRKRTGSVDIDALDNSGFRRILQRHNDGGGRSLLSLTDVSGSPTTAKLDGGTPADEKPANASQQLSRAKKAAKPKIKPAKPVV